MPSTLALIVFYCWPLVTVVLFRMMSVPKALCWSLIAGYLLLPARVGFNISGLPTIDKTSMPTLVTALLCLLLAHRDRLGARQRPATQSFGVQNAPARIEAVPRRGGPRVLIYGLVGLLILAPVATMLSNSEPLVYGTRVIPGLTTWDMGSMVQGALVSILPFLLAMRFLATTERHKILLWTLVIAALGYSLLVAYEIRMSPQLNIMFYGFFPHSFQQHMRAGAFRPLVFLPHGLWLGIFIAMAVLSACVLWRQALRDRIAAAPWIAAALWLAVILLLSRSLGAAVLIILLAPIILITPPRIQILVAASIAGFVLLFPMLRSADLVPVDGLLAAAERVDSARAQSLGFRFRHEDMLLEKANEKPLAGWGTWGRNRVFQESTGRDLSVTDGAWILTIGSFGWLGYIARFGLLTLPIIFMALRRRDSLSPATTGLALVATAGLVDLIPNATLTPLTYLVGGALAGRYLCEERRVTDSRSSAREGRGPARGTINTGPDAPAHVRRPRTGRATALVSGRAASSPRRV